MNRIKKVMESKQIADLRPTESLLNELGVTVRSWIRWTENKSDPTLKQLTIIAEFLDCNVGDLVDEKPPKS